MSSRLGGNDGGNEQSPVRTKTKTGLSRRPSGYWASFSGWWRQRHAALGVRPTVNEVIEWYHQNATVAWTAAQMPSLKAVLRQSKGLRPIDGLKEYFREYRKKRKQQGGQALTSAGDAQPARRSRPAKRCRGRAARSDSSEEEDEDLDCVPEEEEEDEGGDELMTERTKAGVAAAGQQQLVLAAAAAEAPAELPSTAPEPGAGAAAEAAVQLFSWQAAADAAAAYAAAGCFAPNPTMSLPTPPPARAMAPPAQPAAAVKAEPAALETGPTEFTQLHAYYAIAAVPVRHPPPHLAAASGAPPALPPLAGCGSASTAPRLPPLSQKALNPFLASCGETAAACAAAEEEAEAADRCSMGSYAGPHDVALSSPRSSAHGFAPYDRHPALSRGQPSSLDPPPLRAAIGYVAPYGLPPLSYRASAAAGACPTMMPYSTSQGPAVCHDGGGCSCGAANCGLSPAAPWPAGPAARAHSPYTPLPPRWSSWTGAVGGMYGSFPCDPVYDQDMCEGPCCVPHPPRCNCAGSYRLVVGPAASGGGAPERQSSDPLPPVMGSHGRGRAEGGSCGSEGEGCSSSACTQPLPPYAGCYAGPLEPREMDVSAGSLSANSSPAHQQQQRPHQHYYAPYAPLRQHPYMAPGLYPPPMAPQPMQNQAAPHWGPLLSDAASGMVTVDSMGSIASAAAGAAEQHISLPYRPHHDHRAWPCVPQPAAHKHQQHHPQWQVVVPVEEEPFSRDPLAVAGCLDAPDCGLGLGLLEGLGDAFGSGCRDALDHDLEMAFESFVACEATTTFDASIACA